MPQVVNLKFKSRSLVYEDGEQIKDLLLEEQEVEHDQDEEGISMLEDVQRYLADDPKRERFQQRYLSYDPKQETLQQRYPWKSTTDEKHQEKDEELANRATSSPKGVSDFDQSFVQFKIEVDPFSETRSNRRLFKETRASKSAPQLVHETSPKNKEKVYSARLQNEPQLPRSPHGKLVNESLATPIISNNKPQVSSVSSSGGHSLIDMDEPDVLTFNIDSCNSSTFSKIVCELESFHDVTQIRVCRQEELERSRTCQDLSLLLETIQSLPNLTVLHLTNFEAHDIEDHYDTLSSSLQSFKLKLSDTFF